METSRVERVRHELKLRELQVIKVEPLGRQFVSVTFHDESLADFVSMGFGDHVKLFIDTGGAEPARRDYTPRHFDRGARTLTLEFALHGEGAASDWARQAAVGQRVNIGGPRGSMIIPLDYDWHLLAGDASAFPAMRRRTEELPAGVRVTVIAIGDPADGVDFTSAAELEVQWVPGAEGLAAALRALALPPGDGFIWVAGEAAMAAAARDVIHGEKGFPRSSTRISAYWKRGVADHHENL